MTNNTLLKRYPRAIAVNSTPIKPRGVVVGYDLQAKQPVVDLQGSLWRLNAITFEVDDDAAWAAVQHLVDDQDFAAAFDEDKHPREPSGIAEGGQFISKALASVLEHTGYTREQLRAGLSHDMVMRAKVSGSILLGETAVKNAATRLDETDTAALVKKLVKKGDPSESIKQFADTPEYDLQVLSSITQHTKPLSGEALCNMAVRSIECGTTTRSGSYRHELGHAIRSALGGASMSGRTAMTKAVAAEFTKVQERIKANPAGLKLKKEHEWYEKEYGVAGRRSVDNWEENFAEHYRLYHREIYRDKHEGSGHVAAYRERHSGWAKIWDAHYTTALIAQELVK